MSVAMSQICLWISTVPFPQSFFSLEFLEKSLWGKNTIYILSFNVKIRQHIKTPKEP